ncbi:Scr1 family TA system antitoxin-like transcriptional regulator [Streptomyces tubbatahanensis]|uniref:Scr1 family TA system antitoxin-like transcriptional regulator n=1 Tax=Streptomyces tubbatahanensis TaxID=2923272 RepID=A0ABY3XS97_9ACTN|nr:Scr1 family TA system antitoxin-like transcriptional regulator [Streptomyces tubbatahanensis]UNS97270.1 Scr1 family TA system antitoxin-like transcriptional regulator [Streptomyces tubbatahanensis]
MPAPRQLDPTYSVAAYLGHKIRREREKRKWTQQVLAAKVFVSRVRVAKVELGSDPPNPSLASRFDQVLGFEDDLYNLARVLENVQVRDYAQAYLARQLEAIAIHGYSIVVPGLLQTDDYARALMLAGQAGDPEEIDRYVERRVARQEVWKRTKPPWMWTLLDAAVLRRETGGRSVMRGQLTRLREMCELPQINVQILPENTTAIAGSLWLLTLPNGDRGAYTEGFSVGAYMEETAQVTRFQRVYDWLHTNALSADASMKLIEQAIEGYA